MHLIPSQLRRFQKPLPLLLALALGFFGLLAAAAALFPRHYLWYRDVISSLASPRDNPHGYLLACLALALGDGLLILCESLLKNRLAPFSPRCATYGGKFFLLGAAFLILSAIIVPGHYRLFGLARSHEHLAQISGIAFCLSLIFYLRAVLRSRRVPLWLRLSAFFLVALPINSLIVSRGTLILAFEYYPTAVYHAARASLWNSLALWEWLGALAIYIFLALVTLGLPESAPASPRKL